VHRIVAAAVLLGVLLFAAAATVVVFRKVARTAGALLVPYVVWLGYALAINVAIVVLAAR
jgi:tryptophan-rich sensory protein